MALSTDIKKVVFMGSKSLGLRVLKCIFNETKSLDWTIVCPSDSHDARSNQGEFNEFAIQYNIKIITCNSSKEAKETIFNLCPDIGFVCGWYWLIDAEVINKVKHGLWGIHNSLLPKYRGGAPLVWAIMNGEEWVGSSIFRISEGMDDGDILHQVKVKLEPSYYISDVLDIIEEEIIKVLPEKWNNLIFNKINVITQKNSDATYSGQRIESDGLINWNLDAFQVYNFIRAQSLPYPCAHTYLNEVKIKVIRAELLDVVYYGTPGQVFQRGKDFILVSCGKNTVIKITSLSTKLDNSIECPSEVIPSIKTRF